MNILIEIYQRLLREIVPSYCRRFYSDFKLQNRLMGIVGARGVGKTTFLLNYLRENYPNSNQALYVSADNLYFVENSLFDLADQFVKEYDGQILCIDEIHKYKNWNQELKNIYDSFPKLSVIFSGSSSIDLVKGKYDLSRRAVLETLYGFSFREYLEIQEETKFPVLTFEQLFEKNQIFNTPKLLGHLKNYWKAGYYPTYLEITDEQTFYNTLRSIVDKVIFEDISGFYTLSTTNLDTLKKIIYFFTTSQPGSININNIALSLKKDHSTIAEYIQILRDTGLLRFLSVDKHGHALVRSAEKIYLDNPNLLYALNSEIGQTPLVGVLREQFVISNLQNAGYHVFYSKVGDIECNNMIFEIGGKDKISKEKVIKDDILVGDKHTIPLYLFGFLY